MSDKIIGYPLEIVKGNPYVRIENRDNVLYLGGDRLTPEEIINLLNDVALEQNSWHCLEDWDVLDENWDVLTKYILFNLIMKEMTK